MERCLLAGSLSGEIMTGQDMHLYSYPSCLYIIIRTTPRDMRARIRLETYACDRHIHLNVFLHDEINTLLHYTYT